jgi:hypothetical protein
MPTTQACDKSWPPTISIVELEQHQHPYHQRIKHHPSRSPSTPFPSFLLSPHQPKQSLQTPISVLVPFLCFHSLGKVSEFGDSPLLVLSARLLYCLPNHTFPFPVLPSQLRSFFFTSLEHRFCVSQFIWGLRAVWIVGWPRVWDKNFDKIKAQRMWSCVRMGLDSKKTSHFRRR